MLGKIFLSMWLFTRYLKNFFLLFNSVSTNTVIQNSYRAWKLKHVLEEELCSKLELSFRVPRILLWVLPL